jgi:uncharacterized protein DUF4382
MKRNLIFGSLILVGLAAVVACNTSDVTSPGPSASTGLSIYLTDAPIDFKGVSAVNVGLTSVTLYPSDGGENVVLGPINGGYVINLLEFQNGHTTLLARKVVPDGSYDKIRIEIARAQIVYDDDMNPDTPDVTAEIKVPSDKVDLNVQFDVRQEEDMSITLDFDAQNSVQVNQTNGQNEFILRPVITVVEVRQGS